MNKNKYFNQHWLSFVRELDLKESLDKQDLLRMLLKFLKDCGSTLSTKPFASYGLPKLAMLEQDDFPILFAVFTDADVIHFKERAAVYLKKNDVTIASFLRFTLEEMLIVESNRHCPRCKSSGMGYMKNCLDGSIALLCKHCGASAYLDGLAMEGGDITYATANDLRLAGLIS